MDKSNQNFLNDLGLEKFLNYYNGELERLYNLITEKDDPPLMEKIKMIEKKRDSCFNHLRVLQREINPGSIISSVNPGYH